MKQEDFDTFFSETAVEREARERESSLSELFEKLGSDLRMPLFYSIDQYKDGTKDEFFTINPKIFDYVVCGSSKMASALLESVAEGSLQLNLVALCAQMGREYLDKVIRALTAAKAALDEHWAKYE